MRQKQKEARREVRLQIKRPSYNIKMWHGRRKITGHNNTKNKPVSNAGYDSNKDLAEALNSFYLRFDTRDFTEQLREICKESSKAEPYI